MMRKLPPTRMSPPGNTWIAETRLEVVPEAAFGPMCATKFVSTTPSGEMRAMRAVFVKPLTREKAPPNRMLPSGCSAYDEIWPPPWTAPLLNTSARTLKEVSARPLVENLRISLVRTAPSGSRKVGPDMETVGKDLSMPPPGIRRRRSLVAVRRALSSAVMAICEGALVPLEIMFERMKLTSYVPSGLIWAMFIQLL